MKIWNTSSNAIVSAPEIAKPCLSFSSPLIAVRYPTVKVVFWYVNDADALVTGVINKDAIAATTSKSRSSLKCQRVMVPLNGTDQRDF